MKIYFLKFLAVVLFGGALLAACGGADNRLKAVSAKSDADAVISPPTPQTTAKGEQTAYFAGGCFWGVEAVFEHVKGVSDAASGFAGGKANPADGKTADEYKNPYAETVKITYDPSVVSYEQLLRIFFLTAHDPTELNRQGPDVGTQYRSAIFYTGDEQKRLAEKYVAELSDAKTFAQPIVTRIVALDTFRQASGEHQNYMAQHPDDEYVVTYDKPKLESLRRRFPDLYVSR